MFYLTILRILTWVLLAAFASMTACNPRQLPGFKQEAKQQQEKITRQTEEAILKSPALQELDRFCTKEIPRPKDFILVERDWDHHNETFLGYGYRSESDFNTVKKFYLDYFAEQRWQVTGQKEGGWGPSYVEFRKDGYKVKVYELNGENDVNYSLHCEKAPSQIEGK